MTDLTITGIRPTMLRVPWPQTPWLKGHALGEARDILVLDVETRGGLAGMGYLFLFRPGMRTIAACLEEAVRDRGDLAGSVARHDHLWARRHRGDGDVGA